MELSGRAALVAATLSVGLMAGVFGIYANSIMPGLGRTDDRTFVGAFQSIDRAIINPVFLAAFLDALVLTGLAVVLHLGQDSRPVLAWAVAALVLYLVALVVTIAVHVPLNDQLKAAGNPSQIADLAAVRERFHEARWGVGPGARGGLHGRLRLPRLGAGPERPHHGRRRVMTPARQGALRGTAGGRCGGGRPALTRLRHRGQRGTNPRIDGCLEQKEAGCDFG